MRLTDASATRGMTRLASSAIRCSIASIDVVSKRSSPSWANAARASSGGRWSACWSVLIGAGPVWSADGEWRLDGGAAHLRTAEGSSARLLLGPAELDPWTWIPATRRIADGTRAALRVGLGGMGADLLRHRGRAVTRGGVGGARQVVEVGTLGLGQPQRPGPAPPARARRRRAGSSPLEAEVVLDA